MVESANRESGRGFKAAKGFRVLEISGYAKGLTGKVSEVLSSGGAVYCPVPREVKSSTQQHSRRNLTDLQALISVRKVKATGQHFAFRADHDRRRGMSNYAVSL